MIPDLRYTTDTLYCWSEGCVIKAPTVLLKSLLLFPLPEVWTGWGHDLHILIPLVVHLDCEFCDQIIIFLQLSNMINCAEVCKLFSLWIHSRFHTLPANFSAHSHLLIPINDVFVSSWWTCVCESFCAVAGFNFWWFDCWYFTNKWYLESKGANNTICLFYSSWHKLDFTQKSNP